MLSLAPLLLFAAVSIQQNPLPSKLDAQVDKHGQIILEEKGSPVLKYNAKQVDLPLGYWDAVTEGNRIYAKPRSGYIHPLYGLDGEELTLDWSLDHPHHRGIYWAWPEVRIGEKSADLHALQAIYSKPVGEPTLSVRDGFARVEALNLWLWENKSPVVFERVSITAHTLAEDGSRAIDLHLEFEALVDGVSIARRKTNLYGGLNIRMPLVKDLEFGHFTEASQISGMPKTSRAWSSATGIWKGGKRQTTLTVIEHPSNQDFPGDFITYENLPWFQPTFPSANTRFPLTRGKPLTLRYRFLISPGAPNEKTISVIADQYSATAQVTGTTESTQSNKL